MLNNLINYIIILLHIIIFYLLLISPIVNNYNYKLYAFVSLCFLFLHFAFKYGKCGFINLERIFLKDNFKNGILYRFIKPMICYKINPFGNKYFPFLVMYIVILFTQIYNV